MKTKIVLSSLVAAVLCALFASPIWGASGVRPAAATPDCRPWYLCVRGASAFCLGYQSSVHPAWSRTRLIGYCRRHR